jgi:hypothetical protein
LVSKARQPLPRNGVVVRGHLVDTAGIHPAIVKVKQPANQNRVIDRFVSPAMLVKRVDIVLVNGSTLVVYFLDVR